ncbi:PE-PGRS family protein [Streptomyces sp. NPDC015220]|uniref:PE-PGRS family protein n=1 Tax=Streptomyces sp. NPDC015220 TaxID=3364947 RepID=UPI0036F9AD0A
MNRMGLGLAVGAGYLLGRTKKLKMAVAVGSMVAGKKLNLGPRGIAELVNQQLKGNPQFKEIGDQLRQDLRGVGKAASGAMVERQMTALADRLHSRTAQVRDEMSGAGGEAKGSAQRAAGKKGGGSEDDYEDAYEDREGREADEEPESEEESEDESEDSADGSGRDRRPARKASAKKAPAKKAPAKKTAQRGQGAAPVRKAAKKAPAGKTAAKKTAAAKSAAKTSAKKTASAGGDATRATRSRLPKGGGDR